MVPQDDGLETDEGTENQDPNKPLKGQTPSSENSPSDTEGGVQSPFSHPLLKGKTSAEIEELFKVHEATVREQGSRLTRMDSELRNRPNVQTPIPEPAKPEKKKIDASTYFSEPDASTRQIVREEVTDIIRSEMQQIIEPFRQDSNKARRNAAWEDLIDEVPKAAPYKTLIYELVAQANMESPTKDQLKYLYFTARGIAEDRGINVGGETRENGNREEPKVMRINPQHRPSNQPLGVNQPAKKEVRELTENERTIKRLNGFKTDEEFLRWQESDEAEVITMEDK